MCVVAVVVVNLSDDAIVIENHGILEYSNDQRVDIFIIVGCKHQIEIVVMTHNFFVEVGLDMCHNVVDVFESNLVFDSSLCSLVESNAQIILNQMLKLLHWNHNIIRWLHLSDRK